MSQPKKMEQRLSLKEGLLGDFPDSECSTPQGFMYQTKFVVLSYLGLVPPDLDPGYSEFDIHYGSSASATPFSASEDDRSSASSDSRHSSVSRRSSGLLTVNVKAKARRSPKTSPRSAQASSSPSPAVLMNYAAGALPSFQAASGTASDALPPPPAAEALMPYELEKRSSVELMSLGSQMSEESDLCTDAVIDTEDDSLHSQPLSDGSGDHPEIRIEPAILDDDGAIDSWAMRQRSMEPLLEEVRQAMTQLQEEFKQVVAEGEGVLLPSEICPIDREALVAERIAQIGDKIMEQRGEELEKTMRLLFGSQSEENLTYGVFKTLIKQMITSAAPGWYHLALMLKFTQRMAVGVVNKGGKGFGSLTEFAVKYIEENLAQTIIDQGGWDAMTNVSLDDINTEILSELSSGAGSPLPLSSQDSHASQEVHTSQESRDSNSLQAPTSPDVGTPVDSPNWMTDRQMGQFNSGGEDGLNQLSVTLLETSPNQITRRIRSESKPEDLASLFVDAPLEQPMTHSVSSPGNMAGEISSQSGRLEVSHSAPSGLSTLSSVEATEGSLMEVDSQVFTESSESMTIVGDSDLSSSGEMQDVQSSGEYKASGVGKVVAAVTSAAGSLFGVKKK